MLSSEELNVHASIDKRNKMKQSISSYLVIDL